MQSLQEQEATTERPMEIQGANMIRDKVKIEVFGEEILVRKVRTSGKSGRAHMPPTWVGKLVKIIRVD